VLYSVAASLDGYIAAPDGGYEWIPVDPNVDWTAFISRFDTVLVGRHTFEVALRNGDPLPDLRTFVFSRTLRGADHPPATVFSDDAVGVVEALRRESGRDIWLMGGGVLFGSLLEAGLVDVVEVALVPILLGEGRPLLPPTLTRTRLSLTGSRTTPGGLVLSTWDVVPDVCLFDATTPEPVRRAAVATLERRGEVDLLTGLLHHPLPAIREDAAAAVEHLLGAEERERRQRHSQEIPGPSARVHRSPPVLRDTDDGWELEGDTTPANGTRYYLGAVGNRTTRLTARGDHIACLEVWWFTSGHMQHTEDSSQVLSPDDALERVDERFGAAMAREVRRRLA